MAYLRSHTVAFLLLSSIVLFSANSWAVSVLTIGSTDSNKYGFAYNGTSTNRSAAEFDFNQSQDDLLLSLTAFDIDTTTEIAVQLNGNTIGYLTKLSLIHI